MEKVILDILFKHLGKYFSKKKAKEATREIMAALSDEVKVENKGNVDAITTKSGSKVSVYNPQS
jgi:hypothetical protein